MSRCRRRGYRGTGVGPGYEWCPDGYASPDLFLLYLPSAVHRPTEYDEHSDQLTVFVHEDVAFPSDVCSLSKNKKEKIGQVCPFSPMNHWHLVINIFTMYYLIILIIHLFSSCICFNIKKYDRCLSFLYFNKIKWMTVPWDRVRVSGS